MSARWDGQALLQPIAADAPCGESLEDSAALAAVEGARLFGRARPLDSPPDPEDRWKPPEWNEFAGTTLEGLARSKDLRLLANLGVALLRTGGIDAFLQTLPIASSWLEAYWADVYPRLDEGDATLRRNAINCLADSMAVVEALRRLPLVASLPHGTFSLRDIDIATGQLAPREGENRADEAHIDAAFAAMPVDELTALLQRVSGAMAAVRQIDVTMGTHGGPDAVPDLSALMAPLGRMDRVLRAQLATRTGTAEGAAAGGGLEAGEAGGRMAPGAIRSRQDAIRALDAVAEYFRQHEPSSPIPLFVDRAKRLVSKNFLEVLADVVPDALPQVRAVGGIPESD